MVGFDFIYAETLDCERVALTAIPGQVVFAFSFI